MDSYLTWLIAGFLLGIVELLSGTFYLLVLGIAAMAGESFRCFVGHRFGDDGVGQDARRAESRLIVDDGTPRSFGRDFGFVYVSWFLTVAHLQWSETGRAVASEQCSGVTGSVARGTDLPRIV